MADLAVHSSAIYRAAIARDIFSVRLGILVGLVVRSAAINRGAMARDLISTLLGLGEMMFLEDGSTSRVVLYRSYGALH